MFSAQPSCFQLKASFFSCTIFCLTHYDLPLLELQLREKIRLMPHFFAHSSVVLDLEKVATIEIDFYAIKSLLLSYQLVPIGVRNPSVKQKQLALQAGLPLIKANKTVANTATPIKVHEETKVITHPVRSGMQLYAQQTDLIVIATVSAGAEIMADGHIHVYGALRGRALAGMQGNKSACIFCHTLDAELVAIAGYYLTRDEFPAWAASSPMLQIYLEDEQIKIKNI